MATSLRLVRASGRVEGLAGLCEVLDEHEGTYDALAIVSVVAVPTELHMRTPLYIGSKGDVEEVMRRLGNG